MNLNSKDRGRGRDVDRQFLVIFLLLTISSALVISPLAAQPMRSLARGYQPRPCGFDLDGDGIIGESSDDCRICDGRTADPDGDGVAEDLFYVDCDAGNDTTDCGGASSPCRSLGYALGLTDGPSDGAEDVLCVRGRCTLQQTLRIRQGGLETTHIEPMSGNQDRAWRWPSDPLMIVGWDVDGDGSYPPADPDDTAQISGAGIVLISTDLTDYVEIAHLKAWSGQGLVGGDVPAAGFWRGRGSDYVVFHDLDLSDTLRGSCQDSSRQIFNLFSSQTWVNASNIRCERCGGSYLARGSGSWTSGLEYGPIRFENVTYSCLGADQGLCTSPIGSSCYVHDAWGFVTGFEVIDGVYDANLGEWQESTKPGTVVGLQMTTCTRGWHVVNNDWIDWHSVGGVGGGESVCIPGRTTSDVMIAGNLYSHNDSAFAGRFGGIREDTNNGLSRAEDVRVVNNVAIQGPQSAGLDFWVNEAGTQDAPYSDGLELAHNTFAGSGSFLIITDNRGRPQKMHDISVHNNLVVGAGLNVSTNYSPASWSADGNAYAPGGGFTWMGAVVGDLQEFRQASGGDLASRSCIPALVGDLEQHLDGADTCARDAGGLAGVVVDLDGEERPFGRSPDAGADEWIGSLPPRPDPENCSDGIDNDSDDLIDCADPDCAGDPACESPPPGCGDGVCDWMLPGVENCSSCQLDCGPCPPCPLVTAVVTIDGKQYLCDEQVGQ